MRKLVLFLDDDGFEMRSLADRLEHEGFEVIRCKHPDEAERRLREAPTPDVIVSDLIMRTAPADSTEDDHHHAGVRFCRTVRELLGIDIPILVLTVVTDPLILAEARQYANEVLIKPVTPREFVEDIREVMK